MNQENLNYLKDNLKYMGFGDKLQEHLKTEIEKQKTEFTLKFETEVNKQPVKAELYFKKSTETEMYFFNKYDVQLKPDRASEELKQTFYINKGHGITLKESYNMLNGRAVHKELIDKQGQKYQAWVQLDFSARDKNGNYERKQFHENYGYDLKEALSYYPVKEMMKEDEKDKLIRSLEKGNAQVVTLQTPDKEVKVFIEANPQYKTINLYNSNMQNLDKEKRQELMQKPEIKELVKEEKAGKKEKLDKAEKKSLLPKKEKPNGLLEKKRTSNKKGLGIS